MPPIDHTTVSTARRHFDFLVRDYRFRFTQSLDCVRYDSADLYLEIWLGGGDNDLMIGIKKDTEKIRPGTTHLFSFQQLVRHLHTGPFPLLADFAVPPGTGEHEHHLLYWAHWTRQYLLGLLQGDFTVLDEVASKP